MWLIRLIGVIVPRRLRADWRQEWEAELRYREMLLADWHKLGRRTKADLVRRSFGAFWDALLLQPRRLEDEMFQDLRYGARMLLNNPGFTFIAVLTLALGIGANAAMFTVFDALVLKPLPLKNPDRLVNLSGVDRSGGRHQLFSYLDYLDYRDHNTTFADLVAWNKAAVMPGDAQAGRDDISEGSGYIFGQIVSANYFNALGARMSLGRGFLPEEDQVPGTHPVIVLSHYYWERQFDSDPNIVGKSIRLQSEPFTVVGVTAPEFIGTTPDTPAFWVPLMMRDQIIPLHLAGNNERWRTEREADSFGLLGVLKPGTTAGQARAELSLIAQQLAQQYPGEDRKTGVVTKSGASFINLGAKQLPFIVPLLLAFVLVLLIACVNVTNLLLARAAIRQKEIGVRLALGASRLRVIRQLLTESVLISAIGGLAGLLAASWTLRVLYSILASRVPELPPFLNLELDYRIFGFTLLVVLTAGIAAGLVPALQASRPDLTSALKDQGSVLGLHLSQSRMRNGLIVTQLATSLMLLIGGGLLVRNLQSAQTIDVGFEAQNLLSVSVNLNTDSKQAAEQRGELRRLLAERLRSLPGIKSVSLAFRQPSSGQLSSTLITIPEQRSNGPLRANYNFVSSGYFETLKIPIVRGRGFNEQEVTSKAPVVVVSEATAEKFWPGQDAVGKHIGIAAGLGLHPDDDAAQRKTAVFSSYEIIGVARNTRSGWVWEKDDTYLYIPLVPESHFDNYLMVRATEDTQSTIAAVRDEAEAIDSRLSVVVRRTTDFQNDSMTPFRALALLSGVLGALALLLASIGLYGVMSFVVAQRTHEIGVRVALGAQASDVIWLFLKEGLRLTAFGIAVGTAGGIAVSRVLASVLVDLNPLDLLTFGVVSLFLAMVALLATYLPARRAMGLDPLIALRRE